MMMLMILKVVLKVLLKDQTQHNHIESGDVGDSVEKDTDEVKMREVEQC